MRIAWLLAWLLSRGAAAALRFATDESLDELREDESRKLSAVGLEISPGVPLAETAATWSKEFYQLLISCDHGTLQLDPATEKSLADTTSLCSATRDRSIGFVTTEQEAQQILSSIVYQPDENYHSTWYGVTDPLCSTGDDGNEVVRMQLSPASVDIPQTDTCIAPPHLDSTSDSSDVVSTHEKKISVTGVNDPPTIEREPASIPSVYSGGSCVELSGLKLGDVEAVAAGNDPTAMVPILTLQVKVKVGILQVNRRSALYHGVYVVGNDGKNVGDATLAWTRPDLADSWLTMKGSISDLNDFLPAVEYCSSSDRSDTTPDSLRLTLSDNGFCGGTTKESLSTSLEVPLHITPMIDVGELSLTMSNITLSTHWASIAVQYTPGTANEVDCILELKYSNGMLLVIDYQKGVHYKELDIPPLDAPSGSAHVSIPTKGLLVRFWSDKRQHNSTSFRFVRNECVMGEVCRPMESTALYEGSSDEEIIAAAQMLAVDSESFTNLQVLRYPMSRMWLLWNMPETFMHKVVAATQNPVSIQTAKRYFHLQGKREQVTAQLKTLKVYSLVGGMWSHNQLNITLSTVDNGATRVDVISAQVDIFSTPVLENIQLLCPPELALGDNTEIPLGSVVLSYPSTYASSSVFKLKIQSSLGSIWWDAGSLSLAIVTQQISKHRLELQGNIMDLSAAFSNIRIDESNSHMEFSHFYENRQGSQAVPLFKIKTISDQLLTTSLTETKTALEVYPLESTVDRLAPRFHSSLSNTESKTEIVTDTISMTLETVDDANVVASLATNIRVPRKKRKLGIRLPVSFLQVGHNETRRIDSIGFEGYAPRLRFSVNCSKGSLYFLSEPTSKSPINSPADLKSTLEFGGYFSDLKETFRYGHLVYTPNDDAMGYDSLLFLLESDDDQASQSVPIVIHSSPKPPVLTLPVTPIFVIENEDILIKGVALNLKETEEYISFGILLNITAQSGLLALAISDNSHNAQHDTHIQIHGDAENINAALKGLRYRSPMWRALGEDEIVFSVSWTAEAREHISAATFVVPIKIIKRPLAIGVYMNDNVIGDSSVLITRMNTPASLEDLLIQVNGDDGCNEFVAAVVVVESNRCNITVDMSLLAGHGLILNLKESVPQRSVNDVMQVAHFIGSVGAANLYLRQLAYVPDTKFNGPDQILIITKYLSSDTTGQDTMVEETTLLPVFVSPDCETPQLLWTDTGTTMMTFSSPIRSFALPEIVLTRKGLDKGYCQDDVIYRVTVHSSQGYLTLKSTGDTTSVSDSRDLTFEGCIGDLNSALQSVEYQFEIFRNAQVPVASSIEIYLHSESSLENVTTAFLRLKFIGDASPPNMLVREAILGYEDTEMLIGNEINLDALENISEDIVINISVRNGEVYATANGVFIEASSEQHLNTDVHHLRSLMSNLHYTPNSNFNGIDEIDFKILDQKCTLYIFVQPENDPPAIAFESSEAKDWYTYPRMFLPTLRITDPDNNQVLQVDIRVDNGSLSVEQLPNSIFDGVTVELDSLSLTMVSGLDRLNDIFLHRLVEFLPSTCTNAERMRVWCAASIELCIDDASSSVCEELQLPEQVRPPANESISVEIIEKVQSKRLNVTRVTTDKPWFTKSETYTNLMSLLTVSIIAVPEGDDDELLELNVSCSSCQWHYQEFVPRVSYELAEIPSSILRFLGLCDSLNTVLATLELTVISTMSSDIEAIDFHLAPAPSSSKRRLAPAWNESANIFIPCTIQPSSPTATPSQGKGQLTNKDLVDDQTPAIPSQSDMPLLSTLTKLTMGPASLIGEDDAEASRVELSRVDLSDFSQRKFGKVVARKSRRMNQFSDNFNDAVLVKDYTSSDLLADDFFATTNASLFYNLDDPTIESPDNIFEEDSAIESPDNAIDNYPVSIVITENVMEMQVSNDAALVTNIEQQPSSSATSINLEYDIFSASKWVSSFPPPNWNDDDEQIEEDTIPTVAIKLNDAPYVDMPTNFYEAKEDVPLLIDDLRLRDPDAYEETLRVTMETNYGQLALLRFDGVQLTQEPVRKDNAESTRLTLEGNLWDLNAALSAVIYTSAKDWNSLQLHSDSGLNGFDTVTINSTDFSSFNSSTTSVLFIYVEPAADPIVIKSPLNADSSVYADYPSSLLRGDEDSWTNVGGLHFSSPDDTSLTALVVSLSAGHGKLSLLQTYGLTFLEGTTNTGDFMKFMGTFTDVNGCMDKLRYFPNQNFHGNDSLTVTANAVDEYTQQETPLSQTNFVITVDPINDAPVWNTGSSVVREIQQRRSAGITGISFRDVDLDDVDCAVESCEMDLIIEATNGFVTLSDQSPLVFTDSMTTKQAYVVVSGTPDELNVVLSGMTFELAGPTSYRADSTDIKLKLTVDDRGTFGKGGPQISTTTVVFSPIVWSHNEISIHAPDDVQALNEGTALIFNGNLQLADQEFARSFDNLLELSISCTNGAFALSDKATGIQVVHNDSGSDVVVRGFFTQLNMALNGSSYFPRPNWYGPEQLSLSVLRLNSLNSSSGAVFSSVFLFVSPVCHEARWSILEGYELLTMKEDGYLLIDTVSLSNNELDDEEREVEVTISVKHGGVMLSMTRGLLIAQTVYSTLEGSLIAHRVSPGRSYSESHLFFKELTFRGRVRDTNAALKGMVFKPWLDYHSDNWPVDEILLVATSVCDGGDVNSGVALRTSSLTIPIAVDAVNDPPTLISRAFKPVEPSFSLRGQNPEAFNWAIEAVEDTPQQMETMELYDPDYNLLTDDLRLVVNISCIHCSIDLYEDESESSNYQIVLKKDWGNDEGSQLVVHGNLPSLNKDVMSKLIFEGAENFNGLAFVLIKLSDLGNYGEGGDQSRTFLLVVNVKPANDIPRIYLPQFKSRQPVLQLDEGDSVLIQGAPELSTVVKAAQNETSAWDLMGAKLMGNDSSRRLHSLHHFHGSEEFIASYLVSHSTGLLFSGRDPDSGQELWRSDGTEAGTVLLKDIFPGSSGSNPSHLTPFSKDNRVYFAAEGPHISWMLKKDYQDSCQSFRPSSFDPNVFFAVATGNIWDPEETYDCPLGFRWMSTFEAYEVFVGTVALEGHSEEPLTYFDECGWRGYEWGGQTRKYFRFSDSQTTGAFKHAGFRDSYRVDIGFGKDLFAGIVCHRESLGFQTTWGTQLWATDGTSEGTQRIARLSMDPGGSNPSHFVELDQRLYFQATSTEFGSELWSTDGTRSGTYLVADVEFGSRSSEPQFLTVFDSRVFFSANTQGYGRELWFSDGDSRFEFTEDQHATMGTGLLLDICQGVGSSYPQHFAVLNRPTSPPLLLFQADDCVHGSELWSTDGTQTGTILVLDIFKGPTGSTPAYLTPFGKHVYFQADDGIHGSELWATDGSFGGTAMLVDIARGVQGSMPSFFTVFDSMSAPPESFIFSARAGRDRLAEFWRSDGTSVGTIKLFSQSSEVVELNSNMLNIQLSGHTFVSMVSQPEQFFYIGRKSGRELNFTHEAGRYGKANGKAVGRSITLYDTDALQRERELTLSLNCSKGWLSLGLQCDGVSSSLERAAIQEETALLTLKGSLDALNCAMEKVTYHSRPEESGWDDIYVTLSQGAMGATGDTERDSTYIVSKRMMVEIRAINDPPSVIMASIYYAPLRQWVPITGITVTDPDSGEGILYVSVTVRSGRLRAVVPHRVSSGSSSAPTAFPTNDRSSARTLEFATMSEHATELLATLEYICDDRYGCSRAQHDYLTVQVDDNGFTGAHGPQVATRTAEIILIDEV